MVPWRHQAGAPQRLGATSLRCHNCTRILPSWSWRENQAISNRRAAQFKLVGSPSSRIWLSRCQLRLGA